MEANNKVLDFATLTGKLSSDGVKLFDGGIIESKEDDHMPEDMYSKDTIDAKLEAVEARSESRFAALESKIDDLPTKFENLLLKNNEQLRKERKESNALIIGTIIGVLGVVAPLIQQFLFSPK